MNCLSVIFIINIEGKLILWLLSGLLFIDTTEQESNVLDIDYQLEYSESNTSTEHQETAVEEYQYCTSLQRTFDRITIILT